MPTIDPKVAHRFPMHGWAYTAEGTKLIRLPISRIFRDNIGDVRSAKGLVAAPYEFSFVFWLYFHETLNKTGLCLREIHKAIREMGEIRPDATLVEIFEKRREKMEMLPVYADAVFFFLRKLADDIAFLIRPLLFTDYKSVPDDFKKLREFAKTPRGIQTIRPLCPEDQIARLFLEETDWFDQLASDLIGGKKGVRASLAHRRTVTYITLSTTERRTPFETRINLVSWQKDVNIQQDLIQLLTDIMAGLCQFLTRLQSLINWGDGYGDDAFALDGNADDTTAFWPEIR